MKMPTPLRQGNPTQTTVHPLAPNLSALQPQQPRTCLVVMKTGLSMKDNK